MAESVVFHGDKGEARALERALSEHCVGLDENGIHAGPCSAHDLMRNQRILDHLLFARRTRACFTRKEFSA